MFPKINTMFVCIKSSVETKKGKSEGTTEVAQRVRPGFYSWKVTFRKYK